MLKEIVLLFIFLIAITVMFFPRGAAEGLNTVRTTNNTDSIDSVNNMNSKDSINNTDSIDYVITNDTTNSVWTNISRDPAVTRDGRVVPPAIRYTRMTAVPPKTVSFAKTRIERVYDSKNEKFRDKKAPL